MNLNQLGWTADFARSFESEASEELVPARVSREDRGGYLLLDTAGERLAVLAGRLRDPNRPRESLPAVGDWVAAEPVADGPAVVRAVLPRRSALARKVAGKRSDTQVLAANVDSVFLVSGLDGDFNPRRVERYLAMVFSSGAVPVVLLNKADICPCVEARVSEVQNLAPGTPVYALSALTAEGLDVIRAHLRDGQTAAILGSSGVGKSTLINALLGNTRQMTGAVRSGDSRGRHTTTRRELFVLPEGGLVIDTPGLRELQLAASTDDVESSFEDIESLAGACRYRDCRHQSEPGCAVRDAVADGRLSAARLANLHKLRRELEFEAARTDPMLHRERMQHWKRVHKAARRIMKARGK